MLNAENVEAVREIQFNKINKGGNTFIKHRKKDRYLLYKLI